MFRPIVQQSDPAIKANRESACTQVLSHFDLGSAEDLLCFLDEFDFEPLKTGASKANRGGFVWDFGRALQSGDPPIPPAVKQLNDENLQKKKIYTSLIYMHGSTCEPRESLIITLAHELQHYIQYSQDKKFHTADQLLQAVRGYIPDVPSESDAFSRSKRVATCVCGKDRIDQYALQKRMTACEDEERNRWDYFLSVSLDEGPTFAEKTRLQCQEYRSLVEAQIANYSPERRNYCQDILSFVLA